LIKTLATDSEVRFAKFPFSFPKFSYPVFFRWFQ